MFKDQKDMQVPQTITPHTIQNDITDKLNFVVDVIFEWTLSNINVCDLAKFKLFAKNKLTQICISGVRVILVKNTVKVISGYHKTGRVPAMENQSHNPWNIETVNFSNTWKPRKPARSNNIFCREHNEATSMDLLTDILWIRWKSLCAILRTDWLEYRWRSRHNLYGRFSNESENNCLSWIKRLAMERGW